MSGVQLRPVWAPTPIDLPPLVWCGDGLRRVQRRHWRQATQPIPLVRRATSALTQAQMQLLTASAYALCLLCAGLLWYAITR